MLEILALQVIAAILGTLSIGGADWLYHRGRIRQPLHSLWVASSSTAICLPLDHRGIPGRRRNQLGIGRHVWSDDVPLDVSQPAEGPPCAKASVRTGNLGLIEQAGPAVVKRQRLTLGFVACRLRCRRWR